MKKTFWIVFPFVAFLLSGSGCRKSLESETRQIERYVGRLFRALEDGDLARIKTSLSDDRDFFFAEPDGAVLQGKDILARAQSLAGMDSLELYYRDLQIRVHGSGRAAGILMRIAVFPSGVKTDSVTYPFCFTGMVEKRVHQWVLTQGHLSRHPAGN